MNIFVLSVDPQLAAEYHCDKHVVKMVTEYAQLLSTGYWMRTGKLGCYRPTHQNHPCTLWVVQSWGNFFWLERLFAHLHDEFQYRYGHPHLAGMNYEYWRNGLRIPPGESITTRPQCVPLECKHRSVVKAYRLYYQRHKQHLYSWTKREMPGWLNA